jgi:hypothetical protein
MSGATSPPISATRTSPSTPTRYDRSVPGDESPRLSDGYDNKGCDQGNPAKPSTLDAAAALPAGLPIYTCAMGSASDQATLEQLAVLTDGAMTHDSGPAVQQQALGWCTSDDGERTVPGELGSSSQHVRPVGRWVEKTGYHPDRRRVCSSAIHRWTG